MNQKKKLKKPKTIVEKIVDGDELNPDFAMLFARTRKEIHKALKVYCAQSGRSIQDVVGELLEEFCKKQGLMK